MRKLLGLLAASLIALGTLAFAAQAATIYVNADTGDDNTGSGSVGAPYQTIATAIDHVSSGDIIKLVNVGDGIDYDAINLEYNWGSLTSFTVLGDSTAPNKIRVPSFTCYPHNNNWPNITFNGVRFTGSVAVNGGYPNTYHADGFQLRNCVVVRDVYINSSSAIFVSNTVGTDSSGSRFRFVNDNDSRLCTVYLSDNTLKLRPNTVPTDDADYLFSLRQSEMAYNSYIQPAVLNNTITLTIPATYSPSQKCAMLQGWHSGHFGTNTLTVRDSSNQSAGVAIQFAIRDNMADNLFDNNAITFLTLIDGKGSAVLEMPSAGNSVVGARNTWRYNTLKSNIPFPQVFNVQWQFSPGDSFVRNVVACSTSVASGGFFVSKAAGLAVVDHNTFAVFGGPDGGAFRLAPGSTCDAFVGPLILTNNIFYTGSTSTSTGQYAAYLQYRNDGALFSNYNCYAHYGSNGTHAIYGGPCGLGSSFKDVGENSSRCVSNGRDCTSFVDTPLFHDSTYTTFDARLDTLSACIGTGSGGSNVGAKEFSGVSNSTDVTAPAAISDLSYTVAYQNRATITWTSPGDDNSTGTATYYDIRYSTSTITEENFFSANGVSGPAPAVAGTTQTKLIDGLSSGQTYYFAIKTIDEAGNVSAISNVLSIAIPTRGGTISP